MSLTPRQWEELERLLSELAEDRLSEAGRTALVQLLRSEPEARDMYIRFMAFCSDLHEQAATALGIDEEASPPAPQASSLSDRLKDPRKIAWRALLAGGIAAAILAVIFVLVRWAPRPQQTAPAEASTVAGWLEDVAGRVELSGAGALLAPVQNGQAVYAGQTVSTYAPESHVTLRLADHTRIVLAGDSRMALDHDSPDHIHLEYGNVAASVLRRRATCPLVFLTAEARVEVLGTRLSLWRGDQRTRLSVLEGEVHVERLSDQRTLLLNGGQAAEVSPQTDLQPRPLQPAPDHWTLDFSNGLPSGWQTGQLVFDALPPGSQAAVRAVAVVDLAQNGQRRSQIRSHNAWNDGLFALYEETQMHVRYRLERPGTFLIYLVCRQHDFGAPVATVLMSDNLSQPKARQWHTLSLPISQFRRTRSAQPVPLDGQLVVFQLIFDSPVPNAGLTIDRIWVTRGEDPEP